MRRLTNLVFDIAAVAPLIDLDMEGVEAANMYVLGDIKLARVSGPLRIANITAIKPAGETGIHALEPQAILMVVRLVIHLEASGITATFIVIGRHERRINGKGVDHVCVLGPLSVALALPHSGDLDEVPLQSIKAPCVEIVGSIERGWRQVEFPLA